MECEWGHARQARGARSISQSSPRSVVGDRASPVCSAPWGAGGAQLASMLHGEHGGMDFELDGRSPETISHPTQEAIGLIVSCAAPPTLAGHILQHICYFARSYRKVSY